MEDGGNQVRADIVYIMKMVRKLTVRFGKTNYSNFMAKWKIHEIWNLSDRLMVVEMFLVVFTYNLFQHGYSAWVEYSWMLGNFFCYLC